ncbi:hypothetical protein Tsubulata_005500 [Turnera subulata]|uniref:RRM domain-containing protein n=1 Tax=Turnera subulata TaxID=218843 RepID=A0A9Q0FGU2_9ROSI|nr:hypothetical protein Tsubulata_005500 [Turnera subulata]
MSLLRSAIRSHLSSIPLKPNPALSPSLLRQRFCTDATQPPPPPPQPEHPSVEPFLRNPTTAPVYGRLQGVKNLTLKSDIITLLEGSDLTPDDIKVTYNRLIPTAMLIRFPSRSAYDNAFKMIARKGRFVRLEAADQSQWELVMPYDGKTVLLQGIPRNAIQEDVERFLCGCEYDPNSIRIFVKQDNDNQDPVKAALVRFHTQTGAMNALITKNRRFCLNNQILMRVLQ